MGIDGVNNKDLARLIVERRKDKKLSQEGVAKTAGLSRSYYSDIERGLRNISVESLVRICMALDTRASVMLKQVEEIVVVKGDGQGSPDAHKTDNGGSDHNGDGHTNADFGGGNHDHNGDGAFTAEESREEQLATTMSLGLETSDLN